MTSKERVIAALRFRDFDRIPIEKIDCTATPYTYPGWFRDGIPFEVGRYTDAWGCVWEVLEPGVCGEVKGHPLGNDWQGLDTLKPPYETLKKVDISHTAAFCEENRDKFIINQWEPAMPNLFERMQHLRGTENLIMDLAYGDSRVIKLRDTLMEYYLTQMEMWCRTPIDSVQVHDDWGSQISLLISPEMWREYFKPMYRQFCDMAKKYGKYIIMHSDGYICDIIPDLIETGFDAINSQLFCMPIEELAEKYHHKICFWGEIDRQYIQPFGSPEEMRAAVRRFANAFLHYGRTGFVAQCFYTMKTPEANKDAEFEEWNRISDGFEGLQTPVPFMCYAKHKFVPDYRNIVNAATNKKSDRIPLYEHSISASIMEKITGKKIKDLPGGNFSDIKEFYRQYNHFFPDMGYDTVSCEFNAGEPMPGSGSLGGHKQGVIQTRKDFEEYPWDSLPDNFFNYHREHIRAFVETLPEGVKGIGGVGYGVFECVQDITGFENLCYIKADDEELYRGLFEKVGSMLAAIWTRLLAEYGDAFCVCRCGDDLGFKSATLLPPEDIRALVIPQYRRIISIIHAAGKPFLLHSCGCIFDVMEDLIGAGIDAKHSNEDVIAPYSRWINDYGSRIGNFGGIDTDTLSASSHVDLVSYATGIFRLCEAKGRGVAIGSGNSIPDYVSPDRYCQMLDTVRTLRKE